VFDEYMCHKPRFEGLVLGDFGEKWMEVVLEFFEQSDKCHTLYA
jgi:hypothetical protein